MVIPTFFRRNRKLENRRRLRRILLETLDKRELMAVDTLSLNSGLSGSALMGSSSTTAAASAASGAELSYSTITTNSTATTSFLSQMAEGESAPTALDAYVDKPDASYSFQVLANTNGVGYTVYDVAMTSQTWRSTAETQWNEWKHHMTIIVPSLVTSDKSLLFIDGGGHGSTGGVGGSLLSGAELTTFASLATSTGTVVSRLASVPYQPLRFAGESDTRSEDDLIAKTYRNYLDGGDDEWPALLPMVKSAVRAMDTVQSVAQQQRNVTVNNFVVSGASKRGWTTWLTAAVDDRVSAIAPMVINVLNMDEQMEHHKRAYEGVTTATVGGYSIAVQDYVNEGIFDEFDTPRGQALLKIVDPYEYRDRLTMPKFMINGTGDEFFVPDSDQFFLDDLTGPTHIRYLPNRGHSLGPEALQALSYFYQSQVSGISLPEFTWQTPAAGQIVVSTQQPPSEVRLWQATNPVNRDFRQLVVGSTINWTSTLLSPSSPGSYLAQVPRPTSGHTAYMVELTYNVLGQPVKFTTEVGVISALQSTTGPRLLSVAPNSGVNFSFNQVNTLQVAPTELVLRFDQPIDTTKLNGVQVWSAGKDGVFGNANDRRVTPGWIGAGDTNNVIIMRFAETLADDLYRVQLTATGTDAVVNNSGERLITRSLDSTPTDRTIESVDFRLQLGAQVLAVVPQPVDRLANGTLNPRRDIIRVYFNDDDLDVASATNPAYYQLIFTNDTVQPNDDRVWTPTSVSYNPATDMAELVFPAAIDQLVSGGGTFRLRVGSREPVFSSINPPNTMQIVESSLPGQDAGGTTGTAHSLGTFSGSSNAQLVGSIQTTDPMLLPLDFPGSDFEPGHRNTQDQIHLRLPADGDHLISRFAYNFALNRSYGNDSAGQPLTTSITTEQMERVREVFELLSRQLGVDFEETASDGFTIIVGDMFPFGEQSGPGGVLLVRRGNSIILDSAEDWDNSFGTPISEGRDFFKSLTSGILGLVGIGQADELSPGVVRRSRVNYTRWYFPGDHDIVHGLHLHRRDNRDVDTYSFDVPAGQAGQLQLEILAERLPSSSNLDSHLSVYRKTVSGQLELIASNDSSFGSDSYLSLDLQQQTQDMTYFVMVTASGNEDFHPEVFNTGSGGFSEGNYDLRVNFKSVFTTGVPLTIVDRDGSALDGDADGLTGGDFNFWFRAAPPSSASGSVRTFYVDKSFLGANSDGTASAPMKNLNFSTWPVALQPKSGDVVRVVSPPSGALNNVGAYEFGRGGASNQILSDGPLLQVPRGVTLMVDAGAVFKLQSSEIAVGSISGAVDSSGSALQVLGTPASSVHFTSYQDESIGRDTNPVPTQPRPGDWGGINFDNGFDRSQGRFDWERHGIFLNYVAGARILYGGGAVSVLSPAPIVSPVMMSESRPTLINNRIENSSSAAMSANPNSFEQTLFTTEQYQLSGLYTPDYSRIGPHVRGNRLLNNSVNALLVRTETLPGQPLNTLDVTAKFDDTDIVHLISENLIVSSRPGGRIVEAVPPDLSLVALSQSTGGSLTPGSAVRYKMTFVDRWGFQGLRSLSTNSATVGSGGSIRLSNLPAVSGDYVSRRLWRSLDGGTSYQLISELDRSTSSFVDTGRSSTIVLFDQNETIVNRGRPDARLEIAPGAIIKTVGARIELEMGAQLLAEGTPDSPIIFTSRADDRFGAGGTFDTNSDGNQSQANAGDWSGILARHLSSLSLDNALVAYGGGASSILGGFTGFNAVEIHQAQARVAHTRFESNASGRAGLGGTRDGRGPNDSSVIYVLASQPVLLGNEFLNNSIVDTAAISINVNALQATTVVDRGRQTGYVGPLDLLRGNQGPLVRGNRLQNNSLNGMRIRGEELTTEVVWDDTDIVHILQNEVVVPNFHTYGGLTLKSRVDEGLVVKLSGNSAGLTATGTRLDIPDRIGGSIRVLGTPGFPVVMTSLSDDSVGAGFDIFGRPSLDTNNAAGLPAPGDWRSIKLEPLANDRNVAMISELERDSLVQGGNNDTPPTAHQLGGLANHLNGGDEQLRLGYNIDGLISAPSDIDVYTFSATSGTTVWMDIDRTSGGLDSVLELIDSNGNILAQSVSSLAESAGWVNRFVTSDDSKILPEDVLGLGASGFEPRNTWLPQISGDFHSLNPHDAGMRIILPGTPGQKSTYYVRVRSNTANPSDLVNPNKIRQGVTAGTYRLQLRLRQIDEIPGSTIQYADIRYATNGIEAYGMPGSSPLLGHHSDAGSRSLGNIGRSERASITIGGNLNGANDVDYYDFSVQREEVPIPNNSISMVFDIDYADGFGRPDTALYIYEKVGSEFRLVYQGFDSNISDDQAAPGRGNDLTDLTRGSAGRRDAYIGPVELPPGDYRAIVSNESQVPSVLRQWQSATAPDAGIRAEPIRSIRRVSTDRFGSLPPNSDSISGPLQVSFDPDAASNRVEFTLADVTAFALSDNTSNGLSRLSMANAMTGARLARIDLPNKLNDLALSPDGRLVGFEVPTSPSIDATSGRFLRLNSPGAGGLPGDVVQLGNSGIQTFTTDPVGNAFQIQQRDLDGPLFPGPPVGDGMIFSALTFYTSASELMMFGVGSRGNGQTTFISAERDANNQLIPGPASDFTRNIVYRLNPLTGAAINAGPAGTPDRTGDSRVNEGAGTNKIEFGRFITTGTIVGLAEIEGTLYAVSDLGELFTATTDGVDTFDDRSPLKTVTDPASNNQPIQFTGLARGPRNIHGDLLFGTTADGTIYAFDTTGALRPVFPGYSYKTQSIGPNDSLGTSVSGIDFSTLDVNLWHVAGEELRFRFPNGGNGLTGNWTGHYGRAATADTYDLPGGAHGAVVSHPIDLSQYSVEDQPMLYFTYDLQTEDSGSNINAKTMRDAFRVYGAGEDGKWVLLATNNTPSDGGSNRTGDTDELDNVVNLNRSDSDPPQDYRSQEVFDNVGTRQARVPLSKFAGKANVRLRFEFSSAGSFLTGDPKRGGLEMTVLAGHQLQDSTGFTLQPIDLPGFTSKRFELDLGLVLALPGSASILDGVSSITVNGQTLTFSLVLDGPNHIRYTSGMSPEQVADLVANALTSKLSIPAGDISRSPSRSGTIAVAGLLPAGTYSTANFPSSIILGSPGVAAGSEPIVIALDDTPEVVRDAIRNAFARIYTNSEMQAAFPNDVLEAWKFHDNFLRLHNFSVTGNDSAIAVTDSRPGDSFSTGASRAANNAFGGVTIDDIIIGFAERGEEILNAPATASTDFVSNLQYLRTLYGLTQIETGNYQLTMRTAADWDDGINSRDFETNDRLSKTFGIEVPANAVGRIADGATFDLSDSRRILKFEFDVTTGLSDPANGVGQGNIPVTIHPNANRNAIAEALRNSINSPSVQQRLAISASVSGQGSSGGTGRSSSRVELHGAAGTDLAGGLSFPANTFLAAVRWGVETPFGEDIGDVERPRPQGQLLLTNNSISNSREFGIVTASGVRQQPGSSGEDRPYPGSVIEFPNRNSQRFAPGVVIVNNILADNTSGGLLIDGDNGADAPIQIARVLNNTFVGTTSENSRSAVGVQISNGASPTILNNIFANTNTGVNSIGTTTAVLGANIYKNNSLNASNTPAGTFEINLGSNEPLFVSANNRRFYLAPGSKAIDSSAEALQERFPLSQVKGPLGLPLSPMLAPDLDVQGQPRVDDPTVNSPAGLGGNAFKDRGAVERADIAGPTAVLINPIDNDQEGIDRDRNLTYVRHSNGPLNFFSILLEDGNGVGPDPTTVNSRTITVTENGRVLHADSDFILGYDANNRSLRLTPLSGEWRRDSVYEITFSNLPSRRLVIPSGESVSDGQTITLVRSGRTLTLEFDSDGATQPGAVPIRFAGSSSAHELATQISFAINRANLRNPADSSDQPVSSRLESINQIMIEDRAGLVSVSSSSPQIPVTQVAAVTDLAGNPIGYNRSNGLTQLTIVMPESQFDFGDALGTQIPTLLANDGARHAVLPIDVNSLLLGTNIDAEVDGSPTSSADGDDLGGTIDDEDGIVFVGPFNRQSNPVLVQVTATDYGMLDGWIDWNVDGDFDDADERLIFLDSPTSAQSIATSVPVKPGLNQFYVRTSLQSPVLASGDFVTTMSRFRLSVLGGLTPTGAAVGGEVEDHPVDLIGGQPPVAQPDSFTVVEDTVLIVSDPNQGILSNDDDVNIIPPGDVQPGVNLFVYDEDPNTASIQPLVNVSFGTLKLNANGTFEYEPRDDFAGTDFFVYRASDGKLISNQPVTVSITVSPINDRPIFEIPVIVDSVEDQGLVSIAGFVSGMLPGPVFAQDELVQRLTAQLVAFSPAAFTVQPTVDANGRLTFQTAPHVNSLNSDLRVRMWVTDDGPDSPAPNANRSFERIFTIQVAEINDPPQFTLSNTQITVNEDAGSVQRVGFATGMRQGPPTATDELIGQTMQFEIVSVSNPAIFAASQSPVINSAGNLTFATAANKNGSAIVVVRLQDNGASSPDPNQNMSLPQTFTITVAAANDPPEFTMPSTVAITEDQGLVTRASFATGIRPGPVGADDEVGQSTQFEVEAIDPGLFAVQPSITPTGLLTFQLAENVNSLSAQLDGRSLALRVRLRDTGLSVPAPNNNVSPWQTLTVDATAVNDSPSSPNLPKSSPEDTALVLQASELLASAVGGPTSDELPQTVRVIQVQRTTALGGQVVPVFSPDNSHIVSITYQPPLNVVGNDSFVFIMQDNGTPARTGTASVEITLQPVNDPPQFILGPNPVVLEDADTVEIPGWVTGILSGPPTAIDELNSQNVSFEVTADRPELFAVGGQPSINPSGLLRFRPAVDANGVAVIRIIAVDDGPSADPNRNRSVERLATITISPVNDAPDFTVGGTVVVDEDSGAYSQGWATGIVAAGGLLSSPATALDENSQQIQFTAQADRPALFAVQPAISSQGVLTFTPAANAFGTALVTVVARDNGPTGGTSQNTSAPKTLTITIRPLNDAPVAVDDQFTIDENSVLRVAASGVLANDTDIDLPLDSIRAIAGNVTSAFGAAVTLAADGSFTYDPTQVNFIQRLSKDQSLTDTFTYRIQDAAELQSNLATVTITVTGVNDPPTTAPDFFVMGPGQSRDLNVLGNDVDVDTLINTASIQLVQLPSFGSVTILASGAVRYTASPGFIGQETFSYTVADMEGNRSAEALVQVVINNTPVAVDDNASTYKNQAVVIAVLSNDSDSDGTLKPNSVQIVTSPSTGVAEALPDGTIRFTPAEGFVGTVSLTYQVADNTGNLSNIATVSIRVANSRWQNPALNLDVNASGNVSAMDALLIINYLNTSAPRFLPDSDLVPPPYLDVNGDERVSAVDALLVINYLNDRSGGGGAEGEASSTQVVATSAPSVTSAPLFVTSQVGNNAAWSTASSDGHLTQPLVSNLSPKFLAISSVASTGQVPVGPIVATMSDSLAESESSLDQDDDVVALLSSKSKAACSHSELVDSFFADI